MTDFREHLLKLSHKKRELLARRLAGVETSHSINSESPETKRLVAYVVPEHKADITTAAMRDFLKEKLPDYMVPSAFVIMENLPLTSNGKLDRKALPEPEGAQSSEKEYEAPRTVEEAMLAQIWEEVLGVKRVGLSDNFFELGGHSLLATQVISRVREAFDVELALSSLFDASCMAEMAKCIELLKHNKSGAASVETGPREEGVI